MIAIEQNRCVECQYAGAELAAGGSDVAAWARDPIMADRTAAPMMMAINPALCQKCDVCMTCSLSVPQTTLFTPWANQGES
jgi:hypothetical protein